MSRSWIAAGLAAACLIAPGGPHGESTAGRPRFAVPFIDDDYPRAVAEAKARGVPIFVENWAPW